MKKSKFVFRVLPAFLLFTCIALNSFGVPKAKQMYYEIKVYRIGAPTQEARIDAYLKDAYIPAMHRLGISKIGVFKPIETDTAFGKFVYVFVPLKTVDQYLELEQKLNNDPVYQKAGKDFLDSPFSDPPFKRYESILLKAFPNMPEFRVPTYTTPPADRIYELRSYESATEAKAAKKIQMFNDGGEIALFESIGANAVFYGQVLLGSLKPRLMYMTTYADMKSHDDHWKAFRDSDGWKKLSGMEEYKNTVSKANPYLLHPTSYSDF
jgi:hypothetical protein